MSADDITPENNPDDHRDSRDARLIPLPRPAPDDHPENLPEIGSDEPVWWYDVKGKRGKDRRFIGHVTRIGGPEGDRLRGDLAAIIRDLLDWAKQQSERSDTESTEDGDTA